MNDDDSKDNNQSKLLFTKKDQQNRKNQDNNKGRWKGSNDKVKGNQNVGNGGSSNVKNTCSTNDTVRKDKQKKDRSKIICYRCDKPVHFASQCPERLQK